MSNAYLYTFFISMVPLIELKGAIPVGVSMGLSHLEAFLLSYVGSIIPIAFVIYLFRPIANLFKETFLKSFFDRIEARTLKKGDNVKTKGLLGLFIFVAIPLPGTGVYSGSLLASLFDIRIKHAFPVIALGNLVAGLIVLSLTYGFGRMF